VISRRAGLAALAAVTALAVGLLVHGPIVQAESYHAFADRRAWWGVPNALDVLSNVPFLIVGLAGLSVLAARDSRAFPQQIERGRFAVVFVAMILVAVGSAYYHWAPTTERLFWDRLPISVVLTALLGIVVGERVDPAWGRRLFWPLVATGMASTIVWRLTGDLRVYVAVQVVVLGALPLLLLRRGSYTRTTDLWWMVGLYGVAKVCEVADRAIFEAIGVASGHTIKHLLAAAAVGRLVPHLRRRVPI
jgi:hypothetical protein